VSGHLEKRLKARNGEVCVCEREKYCVDSSSLCLWGLHCKVWFI